MSSIIYRVFFFISIFYVQNVLANGVDDARNFFLSTSTMEARFYQAVTDKSNYKLNETTGGLSFERPNKYSWWFNDSISSGVTCNGKEVVEYDLTGMGQTTKRVFKSNTFGTPAEILASGSEIFDNFNFESVSRKDGLTWVRAKPKTKSVGVKGILMGFEKGKLKKMVVMDDISYVTHIQFSNVATNLPLSRVDFTFEPIAAEASNSN